jgi:hypothetical protein
MYLGSVYTAYTYGCLTLFSFYVNIGEQLARARRQLVRPRAAKLAEDYKAVTTEVEKGRAGRVYDVV